MCKVQALAILSMVPIRMWIHRSIPLVIANPLFLMFPVHILSRPLLSSKVGETARLLLLPILLLNLLSRVLTPLCIQLVSRHLKDLPLRRPITTRILFILVPKVSSGVPCMALPPPTNIFAVRSPCKCAGTPVPPALWVTPSPTSTSAM